MDYLITFDDGSSGYLSHHGVLGMKWGVRNAETLRRYASEGGQKPTKRQVKKAIRENKKAYKKATGGKALVSRTDVGSNVNAVRRQHANAKANDVDLQNAEQQVKKTGHALDKANERSTMAEDYYDRLRREDSGATKYQIDRAKKAYIQAEAKRMTADDAYRKARKLQHTHVTRIAKQYLTKYENAAVKDLGFDNVEAGKALLNEYGLMGKAINANRYDGLRH